MTTFIYVTHDQMEAMTMASRVAVINKGVLQQLDSPQNLYDHPQNKFVAGFIGSPAMNFFPGKIEKSDSNLFVDIGDFRVKIPKNKSKAYENYIQKQVMLGIRPENIYHPDFIATGIEPCIVDCKVEVVEPMGNEIYLYLVAGSHHIIARVDPRATCKTGDRLGICFNMSKIHLFDPEKNPENPEVI